MSRAIASCQTLGCLPALDRCWLAALCCPQCHVCWLPCCWHAAQAWNTWYREMSQLPCRSALWFVPFSHTSLPLLLRSTACSNHTSSTQGRPGQQHSTHTKQIQQDSMQRTAAEGLICCGLYPCYPRWLSAEPPPVCCVCCGAAQQHQHRSAAAPPTLYSRSMLSGGSSMLAFHTCPSLHVMGSASSTLHEPRLGWLPTSTTFWPGLVCSCTPTSTCASLQAPDSWEALLLLLLLDGFAAHCCRTKKTGAQTSCRCLCVMTHPVPGQPQPCAAP